MTKPKVQMNAAHRALLFVILVSSFVIPALAQENTPPPEKKGVQLQFIPPPMEGTISMAVYDSTGKLIRTLHQDAPTTDFFPALNGLITYWDGKDDSGKLMPAGKYHAKGYMMTDNDFDGVAFLGNDFVDADGKVQIHRIAQILVTQKGNLAVLENTAAQPGDTMFVLDPTGKISTPDKADLHDPLGDIQVKDGKLVPTGGTNEKPLDIPGLDHPIAASAGRDGTIWVIDGADVKQLAPDGHVLRHLATKAGDPAPIQIQASPLVDEIFLLEQNDKLQRIRALVLQPDAKATGATANASVWKVMFTKTILFSDKIDQVRDLLKTSDGKPFIPQDKITLKLAPNPLEQNKAATLDIAIGADDKGSFIKTLDGLPLCRVSETPRLQWAALALESDGKTVTIFQSDGSVIEQFKAANLSNMAGFDAGDFDFDPATVK